MRTLLAIVTSALLGGCALAPSASTAPADHDHASVAAPSEAQMDAMMKSMQAMHDKMTAAKTPEERHALMSEHMKTMQEGMSMMGRMRGGKGAMGSAGGMRMGMGPDTMSKRMDMMEMMMQMMMEREAGRSAPPK